MVGWQDGWGWGVGWIGGNIVQSNISYAINPIWFDIPHSHTVKNKAKMLLFTVCPEVKEEKRYRLGEKDTDKKERDHAVQHL